jgi:hypothetical protein
MGALCHGALGRPRQEVLPRSFATGASLARAITANAGAVAATSGSSAMQRRTIVIAVPVSVVLPVSVTPVPSR